MKRRILRRENWGAGLAALALLTAVITLVMVWLWPGTASAPAVKPFGVLQPQSVTKEVIPDFAGVRRTYEFDLSHAPGAPRRLRHPQ